MHPYWILTSAIAFEVTATMLLPQAHGFTKLLPSTTILILYGLSFFSLSLVTDKIPLAILYATWAGLGLLLVTLLSFAIYKQHLSWQTLLGLITITVGVIITHVSSPISSSTYSA